MPTVLINGFRFFIAFTIHCVIVVPITLAFGISELPENRYLEVNIAFEDNTEENYIWYWDGEGNGFDLCRFDDTCVVNNIHEITFSGTGCSVYIDGEYSLIEGAFTGYDEGFEIVNLDYEPVFHIEMISSVVVQIQGNL